MKFIVDKEISLSTGSQDMLHTKRYADLLLQSVKDAPKGEPYTIGLFGEWGSGKSSVIKTLVDSIPNDSELNKVKIVTYDAWKYSGDSFRRMFLFELRSALGVKESPLMQRFYVNETREVQVMPSVNWKKVGILAAFILISTIAMLMISVFLGIGVAIPSTIALVALFFSLCTFIFDQLKVSVQKPLLFAPEQFEECYKEMVGCVTKWDKYKEKTLKWITLGRHHEQYIRLVIVVDNIDRCQPDKAYTLLTDIKNFLCREFDVIFIVPVDIEALRKHILKSSEGHKEVEADEFLRKFFSASVWMKPYQNDEMFDFADNLAKKNSLSFNPNTISLVSNEFATNPRRIIQLFNNLQIELSCYEPTFATEHQTLICKLLVIREEFPEYYKCLLFDPKLFFVDIESIRKKAVGQQTEEEKLLLSNVRLSAFLLATTGVSSKYTQQEDVLMRILVNSQIKNNIPENIRQAYRVADKEALYTFAQDAPNRKLLINYLQDNIKKMVKRGSYDAEGKIHLSVLLALFDKELLTVDDKNRLLSPLDSPNILGKCVPLFADKEALIRFGVNLETLNMPRLTDAIISYFRTQHALEQDLTADDIKNLNYGVSAWNSERCKSVAKVFFKALQTEPLGCRQFDYGKEKNDILFTDVVFNFLLEQLKVENCTEAKSAFQTIKHLAHTKAISEQKLLLFISKATEIAPAFDRANPQKEEPISYLKVLSDIFGELYYLGSVVPLVAMIQLFDKINAAVSVNTNPSYNRTVTTIHSLVTDKAGDEFTADIIGRFFTNANLLADGPVVINAEIERFMKVEKNRDRMLDAMMFLKGQGKDISAWTNAILTDNRRTDIRRIELLKSSFVQKDNNCGYEVDDNTVKSEISELINVVQRNEDGTDLVVEMLRDLLVDERIDMIVRDILSQKTLEEQKQLPLALMQKAIDSFEKNIDALNIPADTKVLQLIASKGSAGGIEGVWGKVNPVLPDGKNQTQATITAALQILMSFSRLSKDQAEALAANVKTLPTTKIADEKKKEILGFLIKVDKE